MTQVGGRNVPGTAQDSCAETRWTPDVGTALTCCVLYLHIYFYVNLHRFLLIANINVLIGAPPNSNIDPLYLFVTFNQHFSEIIFMLFKYLIR